MTSMTNVRKHMRKIKGKRKPIIIKKHKRTVKPVKRKRRFLGIGKKKARETKPDTTDSFIKELERKGAEYSQELLSRDPEEPFDLVFKDEKSDKLSLGEKTKVEEKARQDAIRAGETLDDLQFQIAEAQRNLEERGVTIERTHFTEEEFEQQKEEAKIDFDRAQWVEEELERQKLKGQEYKIEKKKKLETGRQFDRNITKLNKQLEIVNRKQKDDTRIEAYEDEVTQRAIQNVKNYVKQVGRVPREDRESGIKTLAKIENLVAPSKFNLGLMEPVQAQKYEMWQRKFKYLKEGEEGKQGWFQWGVATGAIKDELIDPDSEVVVIQSQQTDLNRQAKEAIQLKKNKVKKMEETNRRYMDIYFKTLENQGINSKEVKDQKNLLKELEKLQRGQLNKEQQETKERIKKQKKENRRLLAKIRKRAKETEKTEAAAEEFKKQQK